MKKLVVLSMMLVSFNMFGFQVKPKPIYKIYKFSSFYSYSNKNLVEDMYKAGYELDKTITCGECTYVIVIFKKIN